jgi:hypothetical protein
MLKVFITVDVELWPRNWDLSVEAFREAWRRYIQGATPQGDYGLPFQLKLLQEHGLNAVFLVESLFAWQYGIGPLRDIVGSIREAGQEVQSHLHAEWSHKSAKPILPGHKGINLREYNEDDQDLLLSLGLSYLRESGVDDVCAFRAGSYGADRTTLRVLFRQGIRYDTSYNPPYLSRTCGISVDGVLVQPCVIEGVVEFPVTTFVELPGRLRHMQIGSCSLAEMKHLLSDAYHKGWHSVVIVSHGHELLNADRSKGDPIVIRRFEGLCQFLADNRDKFATAGFAGVNAIEAVKPSGQDEPLSSSVWRTAWRYGEQLAMRML